MKQDVILVLVRGAKLKEPGCELALIKAFRPLLKSFGYKYCFIMSESDDYFNEGVLVILECIDSYDEALGVPFAGYLQKILFYYYVGRAKKHKNLSSLDATLPNGNTSLLEVLADDTVAIEDDFVNQEDLKALFGYLPLLKKRQRWIIEEHYFKQQSFVAISVKMGVTANSLVKLHRRAIADLRTYFGLHLVN